MADKNPWKDTGRSVRTKGIAIMIPMVFVVPPVLGGIAGQWLANKYDAPWMALVAVLVGLGLGAFEAYRLMRDLSKESK